MRRIALTLAASLLAALSIAFAASGGHAADRPSLSDALTRTSHLASVHYGVRIQIREQGNPVTLHIRGQSDAHTISVHFASQGMTGGELVYGPFLYEQAPDGIAVDGKVRWLRTTLSQLPPDSRQLMVLHALRIGPLLQVVGHGRLRTNASGHVYRGLVAYDDPTVRASLANLTGGIEFRRLRLTVHVSGGLIHRLLLTGTTADGSSTLKLAANLFAFDRPIHVVPPKPGTFMDVELEQLSE
jgi:hypothetical protein